MGHRGTSIDQCYGALRRRPAAFLHVRRVMFVAARLESQNPKEKRNPFPYVYGGRSIGIYNILI